MLGSVLHFDRENVDLSLQIFLLICVNFIPNHGRVRKTENNTLIKNDYKSFFDAAST